MKLIDALICGKAYAEAVQTLQKFGDVGLGDTLADVSMCGATKQLITPDGDHHQGEDFRAYTLLRLHRGGMPRFRLSHGLAAKLALTDCDGIDPSEIRLPFDTFMVELPYPNSPVLMDDGFINEIVDCNFLLVAAYRASEVPFASVAADRFEGVVQGLADRKRTTEWTQRCLHMIAMSSKTSSYLFSHMRVDESIVVPALEPVIHEDGCDHVDLTDKDTRALTLSWRIVVNLILYLKYAPSGSGTSHGKTVNHDHGLHSIVYELGRDVKLDRNLRDATRAFCVSGRKPQGWILAKRFVVRGHWKQQPCGPGRSERRMIFVEPYWKGPADAPAVAHAHADTPKRGSDG